VLRQYLCYYNPGASGTYFILSARVYSLEADWLLLRAPFRFPIYFLSFFPNNGVFLQSNKFARLNEV
jgi:hypothetical protein